MPPVPSRALTGGRDQRSRRRGAMSIAMPSTTNQYSDAWFDLFGRDIPAGQTAREVCFIRRFLPNPSYHHVLDVCCGDGRHCELLANSGYHITGLDRSADALAVARKRCPAGQFVERDMREIDAPNGTFDAIICMWQSFGYFDEATNAGILENMVRSLAGHGRLILDIYNPAFFQDHQGTRRFVKNGREVVESKWIADHRLTVELSCGDDCLSDRFEWRLYEPDELCEIAREFGLEAINVCEDFDEKRPPSKNLPRTQFVFGLGRD